MTRTWKLLGVNAVLAGALAATPAIAQTPETPAKPPDAATLAKQLDDLKKGVDALRDQVLGLAKDFDKDRTERQSMEVRFQQALADLAELKKQMSQVRTDMDGMRSRSTTSGYTPAPPAGLSSAGRLRLINSYLEPVTVVVNSKAYPLQPGETRFTDQMAAGSFNYEVVGVQPLQTRTLAPGETFTVTVYPR